jgi:hypothetical protein
MERIEIEDVVSWKSTGARGPVDPSKLLTILNSLIQEIECLKVSGFALTCPPVPTKEPTTGGWEERFDKEFVCAYSPNDISSSVYPGDIKAFIAQEKEESRIEGMRTHCEIHEKKMLEEIRELDWLSLKVPNGSINSFKKALLDRLST